MDSIREANEKPSCSKSFCKEPSMSVIVKNSSAQPDVILIGGDDSCDSDYETGSALSRSFGSSSTADLQEMKNVKLIDQPTKWYYANVHFERNIIAPWPQCYVKEANSKPNGNQNDTIVISDNDSDDDDASTSKQFIKFNGTSNLNKSVCDVIILDSDDEEFVEPIKYHTVVQSDGTEKRIPDHYMANGYPPDPDKELPPKTRIIAKRKQEHFPNRMNEKGETELMYKNDDSAFYAGIISYKKFVNRDRRQYLVFFDDGHVQYVASENIRVVFGNYGVKYVHENARTFYEYYFNGPKECKLTEATYTIGQKMRTFLNSKFELATVCEYHDLLSGLVLMHFEDSNTVEWLYSGSPRFEFVWKTIVRENRLKRYHHANTTLIEVSSDSEEDDDFQSPQKKPLPKDAKDPSRKMVRLRPDMLIDDYKPTRKLDRQHVCGHECVRDNEQNHRIFDFDPLKRPLLAGWTRKCTGICYYIAPCGRPFNTIENVHKYLKTTKSKLSIDCFTFSTNIDCMTEMHSVSRTGQVPHFLNDIIIGGWKEKQQISVVPIAENLPYFKEYVIKNYRNPRSKKVPAILNEDENPFRSCCDCVDDCSDKSKCSCWQLTLDGQRRQVGYKFKKLYGRVDTGIYECNPNCKCSTSQCLNRVVSAQIEQKLELYETKDRGYGIRCQTDIPKGSFVSCYFGDLLHGKTADERAMKKVGSMHGDEYFMQLDHIEVAEQYKDGYESDVSVQDFSDDEAPPKRCRLDESVTKPHNNYIRYFPDILKERAQIEVNQRTTLFGEKAVEFVVDGRYRGNISRFFNHSCQPNMFSQTVFVDSHDLRFPWLAFFTSEDIKAGTELTWDYNYQIGSIEGREMQCRCGAPNCRKRLL